MAKKKRADGQLVELAGRNWLVSQLVQGGIEVARPERDRGVDLIAYIESPRFSACRVQLKVSSTCAFVVHREKYEGMLLVYVWHVQDSKKTIAYAMKSEEARKIAVKMGWTKNRAWKRKNGYWRVPKVADGGPLMRELARYRMKLAEWKSKIRTCK